MTGALGAIGSAVVRRLVHEGEHVVVFDARAREFKHVSPPDDVTAGPNGLAVYANDTWKLPIAGVKVYVLGHEDQAVYTDAQGHFTLTNVPTGDAKVEFDGTTATNDPSGFYFPVMVMDATIRPGIANTMMASMGTADQQAANAADPAVYLPRVASDILTPISNTQPTVVTAPADAISGAGNFSLPAARRGAEVMGVDADALAVAAAARNAMRLGLKRAEFAAMAAAELARFLLRARYRPDVVIMDPPRAGARELIEPFLRMRAPQVIYVSCDVATLARDLHALCAGGYRIAALRALDFFPNTHHAEVIAHAVLT